MNPYRNEDVLWQRLKDIQVEAENRRLYGPRNLPVLVALVELLGRRAWLLAGLAMRRVPRRRPLHVIDGEDERASNVA